MGIKALVDDSLFLEHAGRLDGALALLLAAIGASSKLQFPDGTKSRTRFDRSGNPVDMGDGEAFKLFLGGRLRKLLFGGPQWVEDDHPSGLVFVYRDKQIDFAEFIYKYMRCPLLHEAALPESVKVSTPTNQYTVQFDVSETELRIGGGWSNVLREAVQGAFVNAAEFGRKHLKMVITDGADEDQVKAEIASQFEMDADRIYGCIKLLHLLRSSLDTDPEDPALADQVLKLFNENIAPPWIITALSSRHACDSDGSLTDKGIQLMRAVGRRIRFEIAA